MVTNVESTVLAGIHRFKNDLFKISEIFIFKSAGKLSCIPEFLSVSVDVFDILKNLLAIITYFVHIRFLSCSCIRS